MTHPIEAESYRRLEERVDLSHLPPACRAVVARVVHATADTSFAETLSVTEAAVQAGVDALARGAPVVVDVEMVAAGIVTLPTECYLERARGVRPTATPPGATPPATRDHDAGERLLPGASGLTLSALAMELACTDHPHGAVFVVGCAPTALERLVDLAEAGAVRPALVVGVPVGFVGAAEAKERLRRAAGITSISNMGERGGSAVAAAIVNALARLRPGEGDPAQSV